MGTSNGELITFNDYAIRDKPGLVVAFVTTVNIAEFRRRKANNEPGADDVAKNLRLEALILADQDYLDSIWGKEKVYDKEAKPISWGAPDSAKQSQSRTK